MTDRYDTSNKTEGQFQPGSNDLVLLNMLSITEVDEINDIELQLLDLLTDAILGEVEEDQMISSLDLCEWHRRWLGNVYEWAGRYRSVNIGKDGFHFSAAHLIPKLMNEFDEKHLSIHTPCSGMTDEQLIDALAIIHIEFILIHPFREGNGRLSRLLAMVMALQAGQPVLDFSYMDLNKKEYFFSHTGVIKGVSTLLVKVKVDGGIKI